MSETSTNIFVKILKGSLWVILVLVLLLGGLRLSLKTKAVQNFAKNKIEQIGNENLTVGFSIKELRGDLWKEIRLTGIQVGESDSIAFIDTLYAKYDVLSFLSGTFQIEKLSVTEATVNARQTGYTEDSAAVFNVQEIVKPDTTSEESSFQFEIADINIKRSNVSLYSPELLPDSAVSIQGIEAQASFALKEEIEAQLSKLNFEIKEGRLPESISFKASGSYENQVVSLQDLVLNTGRTLFKANGFANLKDSVFNSDIKLDPLSTEDVRAYAETEIPKEEVVVGVKLKGDRESISVELNADAGFARNLEATATFQLKDKITLTQLGIRGDNLDIGALTNDSLDVQTGLFQMTMDGAVSQEYEKADITWGFTIEGIRYEEYNFSRFFGSGSLKKGKLLANLDVTTSGEENVRANTTIENVFNDTTSWRFGLWLDSFNAQNWAEDAPRTDIRINITGDGNGFELSEAPWNFTIANTIRDPRSEEFQRNYGSGFSSRSPNPLVIGEEEIKYVYLDASISKDSVKAEGFTRIQTSDINFKVHATEFLSELPSFNYQISSNSLDVSELSALSEFPTDIDFDVSGKGRGSNLENLTLEGSAKIDTSFVNGAKINVLNGKYNIENGILKVPEATLKSDIANADFRGRRNIRNEKDPENVLSFDLELKNTQPFAELADLEILQVTGNLSADVYENEEGILECKTEFDLQNIVVDELFLASGISGSGEFVLKEREEGSFEIDIKDPKIYETVLQDIKFTTKSTRTADSLFGSYSIEIQDNVNGRINNAGTYELLTDSMHIAVVMDKLDFITNDNSLKLQNSFNISVKNGEIRTDSLELVSPNGAFLSLAVPYADSLNQQIWFVGENFDFGVLQEIIFSERYIDGVLSGRANINKTETTLTGNGNLELQNIEYEGVQADVFSIDFDAKDKRIQSNLSLIWDSKEVISGSLDVPLDLSDPEQLSDEFYTQSVKGNLIIRPTSLSRFKSALEKFEITGTEGIVSFNGTLSGTAGTPNFEGSFNVQDPVLSDVRLDSVFAEFNYSQEKENIIINTEVLAARQKAADIDIDFPFSYNFKTFELNTVDEDKPVSVEITTRNFNLAVFNDFVNKEYTKDLKGSLNGELSLKGTEDEISTNGYFDLTKTSFESPIAGIKVDGIKSRIEFSKDKILLKQLSANSGKGSFNASGTINLDGLYPTTLDIQAKANQFKLANTDEYNLVVDLDSRLSGPVSTPKATGRFAVKNGFIVLDDFGDKTVEDVTLEGEEATNVSYYDSLSIEMEFAIERNFFVRNRRYLDLEIEIEGDLDAQKETNGELSLFGSLRGTSGYVRPLGKRFELDEAELVFSGPPANPDLNVKSAYVPVSRKGEQEVTLYYIIKGTAENPEYVFESDPPMEQQDIYCYTLFNKPCYAFDSWQNALVQNGGSSPTDLLTGVLLDEVEALATRELGVDVVQIDNTRVGNETGTSIKTGWYLNDRTFFAIVNEITSSDPKTLFILEYALSKTWDLIITEGEDSNRRGIDFRYQYDY
ncbi:MAG: translocation/assembly module TamB [Balneola sp.]|nr:translocation/assembly module TamB [Balneola sp.]MBO6651248.1 translocation/assembly module TamB [Balneola sp.]MBO6712043.1 translocation/assembly module TamB [Balneola sp.]MBO6800237.1 translocation/assembly module TamB [Balneola sp.]MBO6869749.1 translocation/assembly module TamB [Balneola sp.]